MPTTIHQFGNQEFHSDWVVECGGEDHNVSPFIDGPKPGYYLRHVCKSCDKVTILFNEEDIRRASPKPLRGEGT